MQSSAAQQAVAALPDSVSASLDELARIGGAPGGGVTRIAWSQELFAAYAWVGDRMRALGLEVEIDQAGISSGAGRRARAHRSRSARISTPCPRAAASTACSASSPPSTPWRS